MIAMHWIIWMVCALAIWMGAAIVVVGLWALVAHHYKTHMHDHCVR